MRRWIAFLLLGTILLLAWLTRPVMLAPGDWAQHKGNAAEGERWFHAGGCASCHGSVVDGKPHGSRLGGGLELSSPVGVFRVPNLSPDPVDGIGGWTDLEFLNAMLKGVSPSRKHYYPAFPYSSYAQMKAADVIDLKAYLDTLPPVRNPVRNHDLSPAFRWRRGIGLWKRLFLDTRPVMANTGGSKQLSHGRYLVEAVGHCGECHTPRTRTMALDRSRWLSGAPNPDGEGRVPDISPGGLEAWREKDIEYYLEAGVDPDFDVVGGSMVAVQANLALLEAEDRAAIAAYLKATKTEP